MSKDFVLTTDVLFGSYCYIEQKRYGVPNEKFLYKIIGKFTSNAWSNVPVDANDKEPHIFNHSEEVVNVVCCGVCEDKIERYKLSDVEIISNKDQQLADLEAKLAESERKNFELLTKLNLKEYAPAFCTLADRDCEALGQIERLKQRLADKEKEIESLKDNWNVLCDYLGDCVVKYDEEDVNGIYGEVLDKVNILKRYDYKRYQDKISFTIQQLEKVKNEITPIFCVPNGIYSNLHNEVLKTIDNQIASLKKEME